MSCQVPFDVTRPGMSQAVDVASGIECAAELCVFSSEYRRANGLLLGGKFSPGTFESSGAGVQARSSPESFLSHCEFSRYRQG